MKIHNFRTGHATNSSSSHSVVLLAPENVGRYGDLAAAAARDGYGWDWFRLANPEDKLRYLCAQLFCNVDDIAARQRIVDRCAQEVPALADFPVGKEGESKYESDIPYVDHQSVWNMGEPNDKTLDTLVKFMLSPRVVVLGGNDNDDGDYNSTPGDKVGFLKALMTDGGAKKEFHFRQEDDYWTVYTRDNGNKVRFSLEANAPDYTKAKAPELVDLKITNYCATGCEFCYQSSTIKGKHAPLERIKHYVDLLAEVGNFEVALGGGEPTDHPDFRAIIKYIASAGMTPNFTTLSDRWLEDAGLCDVIKRHVGGIGVSCHGVGDLALAHKIADAMHNRKLLNGSYSFRTSPVVTVQHVIGSVPTSESGALIQACFDDKLPILLLGYKRVGFGKTYAHHDGGPIPLFLKMALETKNVRSPVSFDTALVDAYPDLVKALGIPQALVTSPEGKFSCYIDAVTSKMGPSSYVEPKTMQPVPHTVDGFKALFATY